MIELYPDNPNLLGEEGKEKYEQLTQFMIKNKMSASMIETIIKDNCFISHLLNRIEELSIARD